MRPSNSHKLSDLNYFNEETDKTQIILTHSGVPFQKFMSKLKYRLNGKYKKTPAFTIDVDGKIYKHFDPKYYSINTGNQIMDKSIITVCLINEGWLDKDIMNNKYYNWIGDIYKRDDDVIEKRWRGHEFWAPYTQQQTDSLLWLVNKLCHQFKIDKKFVGHNTKIDNVRSFNGIVFRSNYFFEVSDLSPAFDLDYFKLKLDGKK